MYAFASYVAERHMTVVAVRLTSPVGLVEAAPVPPDLRDISAPVVETCGALTLSLFEGDLDAAQRLFGFLLDLLPDRRSALADVLYPLTADLAAEQRDDWSTYVETCGAILLQMRRAAPTRSRRGVLLHSPANDVHSLRMQMISLLLDDVQVPAKLLLGCDPAAVQ